MDRISYLIKTITLLKEKGYHDMIGQYQRELDLLVKKLKTIN